MFRQLDNYTHLIKWDGNDEKASLWTGLDLLILVHDVHCT